MSDPKDVVEARLAAVFDEADATLTWIESSRGPAVVQLARLRLVLVAAGLGCVAAMNAAAEGDPSEAEDVSGICRDSAQMLEEAIGPQLAARWSADNVMDRLTPEGLGVYDEPVDGAVMDQALVRVGLILVRTADVLDAIAEDQSILLELRGAASKALHVLDHLGDGEIGVVLRELENSRA
jgi:hypothetical protein